jgi:hypothetical protein
LIVVELIDHRPVAVLEVVPELSCLVHAFTANASDRVDGIAQQVPALVPRRDGFVLLAPKDGDSRRPSQKKSASAGVIM